MANFLGYGSPEALEDAIKKSKGEQSEVFIIREGVAFSSGLL